MACWDAYSVVFRLDWCWRGAIFLITWHVRYRRNDMKMLTKRNAWVWYVMLLAVWFVAWFSIN